jgi:hypothetical protein
LTPGKQARGRLGALSGGFLRLFVAPAGGFHPTVLPLFV